MRTGSGRSTDPAPAADEGPRGAHARRWRDPRRRAVTLTNEASPPEERLRMAMNALASLSAAERLAAGILHVKTRRLQQQNAAIQRNINALRGEAPSPVWTPQKAAWFVRRILG